MNPERRAGAMRQFCPDQVYSTHWYTRVYTRVLNLVGTAVYTRVYTAVQGVA